MTRFEKSLYKFGFLIAGICLLSQPLFAEVTFTSDSTGAKKFSDYIEHIDSLMVFRLSGLTESEFFEVKGDNFRYDVRPNAKFVNKLHFSYRFLSFSFAYALPFIPGNDDNDLKGKTKSFKLGFNIITRHWMQQLEFGRTIGYYLENTGDYISDWEKGKDPYIQFPDQKVITIKGATGYKFNPFYSLNSIVSQSEIQKKSCGSFIPSLYYYYYVVDSKSDDPSQTSSQKSNSFDLQLKAGYNYTLVVASKWYAAGGIALGYGYRFVKLLTRYPEVRQTDKYNDPGYSGDAIVGIGFNDKRFFAGGEVTSSYTSNTQQHYSSIHLNSTRTFFQVFLGYRFNAPRIVKEKTRMLQEKAPGDYLN